MALLRRDSGSPPSTRSRGKVSEPAAGLTSTMLMLSLHPTSAKGGEWEKNNLPHARAVKATGLLSGGRFASAVVTHVITVTETKKKSVGNIVILSYDGCRGLSDAKQDESDTAAVEYPETAHRFNFRVWERFVCTNSTAFRLQKCLRLLTQTKAGS